MSAQAEPPPAYVPVSPGALPDEPATGFARCFRGRRFATGTGSQAETRAAGPRPAQAAEETDQTRRPEPCASRRSIRSTTSRSIRAPSASRRSRDLNRTVEDNPYEAAGIRFGTFILKPTIETGVTATSNADFSADGSEAVLSETTLRLNAASDWASQFGHDRRLRHLPQDAVGPGGRRCRGRRRCRRSNSNSATNIAPAALSSIRSRRNRPPRRSSSSAQPTSRIRQTVGGTLGLEKDIGKARFGITGGISPRQLWRRRPGRRRRAVAARPQCDALYRLRCAPATRFRPR